MIAGETKRRKVQDSNKMTRIKLEEFKRFSQSIMWRLMMDFYSSSGKDAWSKEIVPSFITSNCHIAKSYARLLAGYIHDLVQLGNIDSKHKLYIVELGGGSGRLAFLILKELEKIKDRIDFPFHQIVYILTDFAEANIQFWEQHQGLSQFVKDGRLDFAKYEAVNDNSLKLRVAGTILRKNQVKNPICIVANYLIDTLCHDVFQVRDGVLMEGLVKMKLK
jgi:SAM-dependent MidA family methyltransferase